MDTGTNIATSAMTALQNQPLTAPLSFKDNAMMDKAAKEFESVFISQFLGSMFSGIKTDGLGGGGQGEEMFRSMMIDKYAQGLEAQGGFGMAASVKAQMLKMQEAHS
jgi:Rod binding domain-containing protein